MTLALAVVAGALIGLSLGALGGGGSILAVPVLVYLLGQTPAQATTGSLVVVGTTSLVAAVVAHRAGNVQLGHGLAFGALSLVGAVVGARASTWVSGDVLLAAFAGLMLLVGVLMVVRQRRSRRRPATGSRLAEGPILTFRPFSCRCSRALQLAATATVVGLLTGFLGVGGGFLIVPSLLLVLGMPMTAAVGTSLVVITMTTLVALGARAGAGVHPDWGPVLVLTGSAVAASVLGALLATRVDTRRLTAAFTVLVLLVAVYTAARAIPALL